MIHVRPMAESDLEWILALDGKIEAAPRWKPDVCRAFLREKMAPAGTLRRFAMVAELDGERAGVALGRLLLDGVENACDLEWIAVEPAMRRRGVGRKLMGAVESWARENGGLRLALEVRAANIAAQRLYAASGWAEAGRRRGYYSNPVEDAVQMERLLTGSGKVSTESH